MALDTKITNEEVYEFIQKFYNDYGQVPGTGFLAGYFKVNLMTIHRKLANLDKRGLVMRIKGIGESYKTYILINKQ